MGCSSSKLDDLQVVALCRERCAFLDEAIQQRFALAEAHVAYTASLKLFGQSLNDFVEHDFGTSSGALPPLPPSPNKLKSKAVDPVEVGSSSPKKGAISHHHSHSNSGSHLHFFPDSDEDDSGGSLHHSDHSSPLHDAGGGHIDYMHQNYHDFGAFGTGSFPDGFMHMNYMKKQPTPSIVYEQRPMNPETVYMGEASSSSSSSSYPYSFVSNNNPSSSSYPYPGYQNSGGFGNYSSYSAPGYESSQQPSSVAAGSSSKPPPPPSPPRASAWDFLNPFESYENYYRPSTPSRDSREVREEEGIPDLEDEDYQHEVVKEVQGDRKFIDRRGYSKSPVEHEFGKAVSSEAEASLYQTRPSVGMETDGVEYDVHVVDKKVVDDERAEERGNGSRGAPRNVFEVVREIKVQFVRASESGSEIAKLLEVGTLPYQRKHVSKMLHVVSPSLSIVSSKTAGSSSSADNTDPAFLDFNEELARKPKNLSSTLQKLYLWEKKLYNEVKAEEKMRVAYDRKSRKLKRLDERGAEANKIDSTRNIIRNLSTKIRIAIQAVDKISMTINKIRDEELWPLLNELIEGLNRMWKCMLECHRSQCQVIREAKSLGSIGSGKKLNDDHLKATLQLERELISWTIGFSSWIGAQKGYIRALNNWLLKCLHYEPEVTDDGIAPFSPSRVDAPPIFVICNQWSQAMDRISEREVVESMGIFVKNVLQLWEQDKSKMHRKMMANKDLERKARSLDREDQKLQKEIQALDKKIVLVSGDGSSLSVAGHVYQSETSNSSLQGSLQRIFEAMERFTSESSKVYKELLQRVKEGITPEHERVS